MPNVAAIGRDLTDDAYWDLLSTRALARFFLLAALYERPRHGYELRKAIAAGCDGCCDPTDAMIYPTIKELMAGGYIECESESVGGRSRKVCSLTPKGVEAYGTAARVWAALLPHVERTVLRAPTASGVTTEPAFGPVEEESAR